MMNVHIYKEQKRSVDRSDKESSFESSRSMSFEIQQVSCRRSPLCLPARSLEMHANNMYGPVRAMVIKDQWKGRTGERTSHCRRP